MIITPKAQEILDAQPSNWLRPQNNKRVQTLYVDAVNFGEEAEYLAPPFLNFYAYVTIRRFSDLKPLQVMHDDVFKDWRNQSVFMPAHLRLKLEQHSGEKILAYKNTDGWQISEIDYIGLSEEAKKEFVADGHLRRLTFNSEEGRKYVEQYLTEQDIAFWDAWVATYVESFFEREIGAFWCAERPYFLHVQGDDDFSWGKVFATEDEARAMLARLHEEGWPLIEAEFVFTN